MSIMQLVGEIKTEYTNILPVTFKTYINGVLKQVMIIFVTFEIYSITLELSFTKYERSDLAAFRVPNTAVCCFLTITSLNISLF
jgi:hypothetical protein